MLFKIARRSDSGSSMRLRWQWMRRTTRVFANPYFVKEIIMSFDHDTGHGWFDKTEPLPLASPTIVMRTRREVREELERSKGRRSLLRRTMLPSFLCQMMGVLIMFHPQFEQFRIYMICMAMRTSSECSSVSIANRPGWRVDASDRSHLP
jgi:hypothetical protein